MKKFLLFNLVLYSTLLMSNETKYVTSYSGLVLRENPNIKSNKIAVIPFYDTVEIIQKTTKIETLFGKEGCWVNIKWKTYSGWVFDGFLAPIKKQVVIPSEYQMLMPFDLVKTKFNLSRFCDYIEVGGSYNIEIDFINNTQVILTFSESDPVYDEKTDEIISMEFQEVLTGTYKVINNYLVINFFHKKIISDGKAKVERISEEQVYCFVNCNANQGLYGQQGLFVKIKVK